MRKVLTTALYVLCLILAFAAVALSSVTRADAATAGILPTDTIMREVTETLDYVYDFNLYQQGMNDGVHQLCGEVGGTPKVTENGLYVWCDMN